MVERVVEIDASGIDDLINVERQCFAYHWTREQFALGLDKGAYRTLGVYSNNNLVGYIAFSLIVDEMEILNLAILPEFRRKGLASILLQQALAVSQENGMRKSFLDVKRSNIAAIELYTKFGYKQVGVRERYYPDTHEDALLFRRDFK